MSNCLWAGFNLNFLQSADLATLNNAPVKIQPDCTRIHLTRFRLKLPCPDPTQQ